MVVLIELVPGNGNHLNFAKAFRDSDLEHTVISGDYLACACTESEVVLNSLEDCIQAFTNAHYDLFNRDPVVFTYYQWTRYYLQRALPRNYVYAYKDEPWPGCSNISMTQFIKLGDLIVEIKGEGFENYMVRMTEAYSTARARAMIDSLMRGRSSYTWSTP